MQRAIQYFERALARDPNYALAYAGLAESYLALARPSIGLLTPKEAFVKAEGAARKALEIDDTLAEAHTSQGRIRLWQWDWDGSEKEYRRALELNPNNARAHELYGVYLSMRGRTRGPSRKRNERRRLISSILMPADVWLIAYT